MSTELDPAAAGSGVEPPVEAKVRRAFGLLERVAPGWGARWAIELWCTPPTMELSQRMPPGVPESRPLQARWNGHRICGEVWGDNPPLLLVHDPDDRDSPYQTSSAIAAAWPDAQLLTTQGLGRLAHYRILRHRPALNAAVEFVAAG